MNDIPGRNGKHSVPRCSRPLSCQYEIQNSNNKVPLPQPTLILPLCPISFVSRPTELWTEKIHNSELVLNENSRR